MFFSTPEVILSLRLPADQHVKVEASYIDEAVTGAVDGKGESDVKDLRIPRTFAIVERKRGGSQG